MATNVPWFIHESRLLRKEKPDLLFLRSELYNVSAMLAARMLRIPVVLEVDCPTAYEHRRMALHNRMTPPALPEWIERWNWKRCHAIITISGLLKDYMVHRGVPESKITVVPNGADPEAFRPAAGVRILRRELGLPAGAMVVGWIGSLYGWSGLENLLAVSKRVLDRRPSIVLLFVGGGKNREIIQATFRPEDVGRRVFLTGTVPYGEVPRYVNAMDVVIVPYPKREFWYPSSMKLFEYMAAQKAVVASAVPQVDEVIRDGQNGFLFDPDNLDEFTDKVLRLADSTALRNRLAAAARKTVLESYTWVAHARKMEAVFRKIVKGQAGHG
jgi:glycosyltransferase involved in cell wall biosynthesis